MRRVYGEVSVELLLRREDITSTRTIGRLLADGIFVAYTLEDPVPPPGTPLTARPRCIPSGRYRVRLSPSPRVVAGTLWSPKLPYLPLVEDVLGFEGVRIHSGNTADDTEGCILVGLARGDNEVWRSRDALRLLFAKWADPCWLTITEEGTP